MIDSAKIHIKPGYYIAVAFSLLIIPVWWVLAWIAASFVHEIGHYFALRLSGCKVYRIEIGHNGAVMDADLVGNKNEFICALAGPCTGFLLVLLSKWFPRLAICAFFQSLFNLIPIYPLDGGRVLRSMLRVVFSERKCQTICMFIENILLLVFLMMALYCTFYLRIGIIPLLFSIILMIRNKRGKYACKEKLLRVK